MTDLADLRAKAEAATDDWYFPSELMEATDNEADAAYIAAASPSVMLELLDRIAELEARSNDAG